MKLSDKVLLGFFGVIFIYFSAAFAEVRFSGTRNVVDDKSGIAETEEIPVISQIILNDINKTVSVIGSDRPRLEVRSSSGGVLKEVKFKVSGDTLELLGIASDIKGPFRISVFVSQGFKGISVNNSEVNIRDLSQEQLSISEDSGHVWMSENRIDKVEANLLNGSNLTIDEGDLDEVSVTIDKSQANIFSPVRVLRGSLTRSSLMVVGGVSEIQMTKDKESNLTMN